MKKLTTLTLIGASALALTAGAAAAQPYGRSYDQPYGRGYEAPGRWVSINQRLANLDRRIDMGVRRGDLTRQEAVRLRAQFRQLIRTEDRYRQGGLNNWERADLDRRFDQLSARIQMERRDSQYGSGYYR